MEWKVNSVLSKGNGILSIFHLVALSFLSFFFLFPKSEPLTKDSYSLRKKLLQNLTMLLAKYYTFFFISNADQQGLEKSD